MQTEHTGETRKKKGHMFEKAENMVGVLMVIAIVLLAIAFAMGLLGSDTGAPSWMP